MGLFDFLKEKDCTNTSSAAPGTVPEAPGERSVRLCVVGDGGAGKTTLARAIVKTAESRFGGNRPAGVRDAPCDIGQEKRAGSLPQAEWYSFRTERTLYSLADCPGGKENLANTAAVISMCDAVILVADANAVLSENARQQLAAAAALRLPCPVIFINRTDEQDDLEMLDLVEMEADEALNTYGLDDVSPAACVRGSAEGALDDPCGEWGDKVMELLKVIDERMLEPADPVSSGQNGAPVSRILADIEFYTEEDGGTGEDVPAGGPILFLTRTASVTGSISADAGGTFAPGSHLDAEILPDSPVHAAQGQGICGVYGGCVALRATVIRVSG